ncbi:MAG: DUF916 domain-containing protein [Candidatus Saccharimonadales bacterium]
MRIFTRLVSIFGAVAAVMLIAIGAPVNAQSQNSGSGIFISPVRTELVINPGETKTVTVTIKNVTNANATYKAIINDFIAGDNEFGQPALILDDDKYAPSHSLKRHIAAIPDIAVNAGQSKDVKVNVTIPKDAAGGGYFGAVRFLAVGGKQGQNITLSASVGSLILVRVPGDIKESMTLASFDVRRSEKANSGSAYFTTNKNLYVVARFKNTGNVHEQPFGKIVVHKGDKVLQTTEINNTDPKGNVLPDSIRRFSVKLNKVGTWGKYTVEGNFGYGTTGQLVSGKTSFFVLPLALIIAGVVLLGLIMFAIFGLPRAIKRYNAGVVRKAGRR